MGYTKYSEICPCIASKKQEEAEDNKKQTKA